MKRTFIYFLLSAATLLSAVSCEKTIKFSGGEQNPLLVVNSIAATDSLLTVNLSHSVFFLDEGGSYADRSISLSGSKLPLKAYVNGGSAPDFTLKNDKGDYVCGYRPKEGDHIRIEAAVDGYNPVYVETTVPEKASFDFSVASLSLPSFSDSSAIAGGSAKCELTVRDLPGVDNYYYLRVSLIEYLCTEDPSTGETDTSSFNLTPEIRSGDVIFNKKISASTIIDQSKDSDDSEIAEPTFSDALFDGKDRKISLNIAFWAYSDAVYYLTKGASIGKSTFSYRMTVDLCALSSDYYYYFLTRNSDSSENYFAEPEQIYSNVKGGIGILGAIAGNPKVFIF